MARINLQRVLLAIVPVLAISPPAAAQVQESGPNGFVLKHTATIDAPPAHVYNTLVTDVGKWWDPEHTYSGDASNLSIEARAGGCFCERLERQGSIQHAAVIYAAPGSALRLSGGLGPLQETGVSGSLTFGFVEKDGRTILTMTYAVGGYHPGGLDKIAPLVHSVLSAQLTRLQTFIESGSPKN
jgi:hypothetical protein